jgi:hypothetical protein
VLKADHRFGIGLALARKSEGVVLGKPWFSWEKEEGETASGLDEEKFFFFLELFFIYAVHNPIEDICGAKGAPEVETAR